MAPIATRRARWARPCGAAWTAPCWEGKSAHPRSLGAACVGAHARRRFGYRRIHDLLRPEFAGVNPKRIWRLYAGMDFVSDRQATGQRLKCLTVADDFNHECVDITVDDGISGEHVTRLLDRAAVFRGYSAANEIT